MSARHGSTPEPHDGVVLVEVEQEPLGRGDGTDGLELGRPPRAPLSQRTKRLLVTAVGVLAAAAVVVVLLVRPGDDPRRPSAQTSSPTVESSAGFAAGPVLVSVDGRDALQPAGLPGLGASVEPVVLDPAPEVVALVTAALPGFRDVRGGRIPGDGEGRYGVYLAGDYDGADGTTVSVSLYTVKAPGTTFGSDQYVSRTRFDREYTVRTDVSVFTGSGWWVHIVSLGPDDPGTVRTGEIARLLPLAKNPGLVATT